DGCAPEPIHQFVKDERTSQRTRSHIIIIILVPDAEGNSSHLLLDPVHNFKLRGQDEIIEGFLVINKHWEMFVGFIPRKLGQDRALAGRRRFWRNRSEERGGIEQKIPPIPRFAEARTDASEARECFIFLI